MHKPKNNSRNPKKGIMIPKFSKQNLEQETTYTTKHSMSMDKKLSSSYYKKVSAKMYNSYISACAESKQKILTKE